MKKTNKYFSFTGTNKNTQNVRLSNFRFLKFNFHLLYWYLYENGLTIFDILNVNLIPEDV